MKDCMEYKSISFGLVFLAWTLCIICLLFAAPAAFAYDYWGSGFIINKDGYGLTAAHVFPPDATNLKGTLYDRRVCDITIIMTDPVHDAAVFKLNCKGPFKSVTLTTHPKNPPYKLYGFPAKCDSISKQEFEECKKNRPSENQLVGLLQAPVTSRPGNSGGPLVDSTNQVFGLLSQGLFDNKTLKWMNNICYYSPMKYSIQLLIDKQIAYNVDAPTNNIKQAVILITGDLHE